MGRKLLLACVTVALAGATQSASAAILFSNISITGSLATGATTSQGPNDIDFIFPNPGAQVGDATAPVRTGNIIITFYVDSTSGPLTSDVLSLLGAVSGSGVVIFNEVVEDRINPGIVASTSAILNTATPPPQNQTLTFSRPVTSIKVKKTLVFSALETPALDLANVSLIEQVFVPTPGTLALVGGAGLLAIRRRRR